MPTVASDQIEQIIKDNYLLMSSSSLAIIIGRSESWVKNFKKKNGLVVPAELSHLWTKEKNSKRTSCSRVDDEFIKKNYLQFGTKALAKKLGFSETKVKTRMRQLGLTVPNEIIKERVANSRFKVGSVPITKGKKQIDYMTPEAIERTKATRFKTGSLPHNACKESGTITVRKNYKLGTSTKWICITTGLWVPLHKYNWEKQNGPIPEGHCLRFIDRDRMNCDVDNLILITRGQNYGMNAQANRVKKIYPSKTYKAKKERPIKRRANRIGFTPNIVCVPKEIPKPKIVQKKNDVRGRLEKSKKTEQTAKELTLKTYKKEQERLAIKKERERKRIAKEEQKIKVLPNRSVDHSKLVPLRLDKNTVIYISPDRDPEQVRRKFEDRHKNIRGFYD